MYDRFLSAGKLHRQSREAREKGTTSRRSSSRYPPAQEPISEAPLVLEDIAEKTLREFSVPSTDNVATGPTSMLGT